MVDNDLLHAAINAYLKIDRAGRVIDEAMAAAIEAYEAAKPSPWRPIEEAKRDGKQFLVWLKADAYPKLHLLHWDAYDREFHDVTGMCWSEHGDVINGSMFRTIDPPTQDAVSRATSAPPAAEASS